MEKKYNKKDLRFLTITSILSLILGLLYVWKGFTQGFYTGTYIIISFSILYIPTVFFFGRNGFVYFNLVYGIVLVFIIAFYKSFLYNNYTGLLAMFVVMMIKPKLKWPAIILYGIAVCIAFIFNEENICNFIIHCCRSAWLFILFDTILTERYEPKKLVLYDDEIKILTALSKNKLQKSLEVEGFSESTIYRRIRAAMKRNNLSKKELLEAFIKEQK